RALTIENSRASASSLPADNNFPLTISLGASTDKMSLHGQLTFQITLSRRVAATLEAAAKRRRQSRFGPGLWRREQQAMARPSLERRRTFGIVLTSLPAACSDIVGKRQFHDSRTTL